MKASASRALSVRPTPLVADEAVSGRDVSVRAQVLNLLSDLRRDLGLTLMFISHGLGVMEYLCETVGVMYLGTMVEYDATSDVFAHLAPPDTRALLASIPGLDPSAAVGHETPLTGAPPRMTLPGGRWAACHFASEFVNVQ